MLVLILALASFTGCGGNSSEQAGSSDEPIVITMATCVTEESTLGRACTEFKKYVEEESQGKLSINILPNSQYGGDRESTEAVAMGTIQMCPAVTSVLTAYSNDFMILDLPFLFTSRQASYDALDGDLGKALDKHLADIGLVNLGYDDNGLRQMTNNVRPINTPDDLKGVKMRVMESPVFIRMFELLGANPVPMSFSEVYTALQQGTVDGQENGASLIYDSKFQEVVKYMSLTGHVYSVNASLINKDFYEGLPEDLQKIIADGVKAKLVDWQRNEEANSDAAYIQKLKDAGMQVNEVTPENMQKFRDAVAPMFDEYKAQVNPELFDIVDKYNQAAQ